MKHDLTLAEAQAIIEAHFDKRERRREYQKANWAQINLRLRIGSQTLIQLDHARGDVSRLAYVQSVLESHLTEITNLLEK